MEIPSTLITAGIVSLTTIIIGTIVVFAVRQYMLWKRYDTIVYTIEHASGDTLMISRDEGGVYVEKKTNNKRFFLKQNDVGLDPDKIPYIINTKGQKAVFVLKTGLKNFRFLDMKFLKDQKFTIEVGEEDVNWALNAYERHKKVFGTTLLEKLLPYIGIALMGLFILAMIVVVLQKMNVLVEVAEAFKEVAKINAQAGSGMAILP
jgi:hypothetical protein